MRAKSRQHRTIQVCGLRSKIFRQSVQIIGRHTDVWVPIFGQSDGTRFKQGVHRVLCGGALRLSVIAFLLIISLLLVPVHAMAAQVDTASAADSGFLLGDADGDGDVTVTDATAVQLFLAEMSVPSFHEAAADTDSSGDVEITDATRIQRFIAGMCNVDGTPLDPQPDPSTCSHHWVRYVIPYNYADLYDNHRSEIPFTNDKTKNKLNQTNMEAIFQNAGWAIYYCDKCHIADYDRFYTNQEFGRTQEEEEELSLQLVNDLRTSLGLKKMRLSDYTTAVAQERAKELLTDFSHDKMREGTTENIATCSGGAKRAFELWKESEGHYAMMTASEYGKYVYFNFGYAYAVVPAKTNAHWRLVMVQVFKRSNMF